MKMKNLSNITWKQFNEIEATTDPIKKLAILENKPIEEIEKLNIGEYEELLNEWDLETVDKFELPVLIKLNDGHYYRFFDFNNVSIGELESLRKYFLDKNYLAMASIMYRKIKMPKWSYFMINYYKDKIHLSQDWPIEDYSEKSRQKIEKLLEQTPASTIFAISFFLLNFAQEYMKNLTRYSMKKAVMEEVNSGVNGEQLD